MKEVFEESNINKLKSEWEKLIDPQTGRIYLTYDFFSVVDSSFKCYRVFKTFSGLKLNYVFTRDTEIRAILPIIIDNKLKTIMFAGEWAGAGYNDFIGGTVDDITQIIIYLKNRYSGYRLKLNDISWKSTINDVLQTSVQKQCYNIPISGDYNAWKSSLKSKTRANINRVYRRIENSHFDVEFVIADKMKKRDIQIICSMYYTHLFNILKIDDKSIILKLKRKVLRYYKLTPIFWGINKINRCKVAYTLHNNKIISFHIFYEEKGGIIIPKCAFDSAFSLYEVGSYNLLELIRAYAANPVNIDTSRGFHKYKVRYGGEPYPNYQYEEIL